MKTRILFTLLFTGVIGFSQAQNMSTIQYNIAIPMGDFKEYIEPASFRGITFDYQYLVRDNLAVGFGVGWQTFYEDKGFSVLENDQSTVSGYQYRYVNTFPIHVTGTYFADPGGDVRPFAGIGIGTIYNLQNTDLGLFTDEINSWHFSVRPEIGIQYDFSYTLGGRISVRYNTAFSNNKLEARNYLSIGLGLTFQN